jgi:hypothetical protein
MFENTVADLFGGFSKTITIVFASPFLYGFIETNTVTKTLPSPCLRFIFVLAWYPVPELVNVSGAHEKRFQGIDSASLCRVVAYRPVGLCILAGWYVK